MRGSILILVIIISAMGLKMVYSETIEGAEKDLVEASEYAGFCNVDDNDLKAKKQDYCFEGVDAKETTYCNLTVFFLVIVILVVILLLIFF